MVNPFGWLRPARSNVPAPESKQALSASLFTLNTLGEAVWSQADYATLARSGYMANPVAHRCIRLISETAAAIPLLAYDGADELDAHPVLDLLRRPNGRQSGKDFIECLIGHLLVSGNAYVEGLLPTDTPRELHLLRPDRVTVVSGPNGWAQGYDHRVGERTIRYERDETTDWCAIAHFALFHPLDDHYGFPPLQAARMALDVHNAANTWNKALLDNSARPSGALVYAGEASQNLSDDQFDRLKQELEDGYTGASRAGRPLLLEGGLDWKAMGYSPQDMDFVEARNAAARDIALAFGVPPMLLGIPGDNTYSNYQEANRAFARQTLLPLIGRILATFNHWLSPLYAADLRIAIDEDRVEGLSAERDALWRRVGEATFLTEDEQREAVGYTPERER